ncbi:MAG: hypothetical protein WBS14_13190 [Rhodomicrobium sp.]
MKNSVIAFSAASVLLMSLIIIGTLKTGIVSALTATTTDATSTAPDTTTASTSSASSSTAPATDASSTSPTLPAQAQASSQTQAQTQASTGKPTLKLVHVVGSKYIDYFTDGTKTFSFPGNPDVDSNLNKPNAPIPSHAGLTWVSTSGMEAYDTPSGDLESGDYAQESDGSYISNVPAYTYTDATSSVPIAAHIATSKTDPTVATSQ